MSRIEVRLEYKRGRKSKDTFLETFRSLKEIPNGFYRSIFAQCVPIYIEIYIEIIIYTTENPRKYKIEFPIIAKRSSRFTGKV